MKYILTILFTATLFLTACGQANVNTQTDQANEKQNVNAEKSETPETADKSETECKICDFDHENYKGDLNKEEIKGLLLALNDEYMALATYQQINKDFNDPRPFINIERAESRHADKLRELFKTYKIPVPENKWINNAPKFESVADACKAGVDAEIANRDLYTELFKSTKREDILTVYKNLQRASEENHLPAFQRCRQGRGEGRGRGRGFGRGQGRN